MFILLIKKHLILWLGTLKIYKTFLLLDNLFPFDQSLLLAYTSMHTIHYCYQSHACLFRYLNGGTWLLFDGDFPFFVCVAFFCPKVEMYFLQEENAKSFTSKDVDLAHLALYAQSHYHLV